MRVQGTTSVGANASSGNVLSGKTIEIPERPGVVRVFAAAAATGVLGSFNAGTETLLEESHISPANRFPLDPDDRVLQDVVMPLKRLNLTFRNTTAGALIVQWAVDFTPVA